MAYSLAELKAAAPNDFLKGVMDFFIEETQLMRKLKWVTVAGLTANVTYTEDRGVAGFYGINEEIVPNEIHPKTLAHSVLELVGEVEIPRLAKKGFSQESILEMNTRNETRRMGEVYEEGMFYGTGQGQSLAGLHAHANGGFMQEIHLASSGTPGACSLLRLNQAIQMMRGKAQVICMSLNTYLYFNALLQEKGSYTTDRDEFGQLVTMYQGLPVMALPVLSEKETNDSTTERYNGIGAAGAASSIWVLNLRTSDGVFGIQNGGMTTDHFDKIERKVGEKVRLVWDCGLAIYPKWCGVRIDGVDPVGQWTLAGAADEADAGETET